MLSRTSIVILVLLPKFLSDLIGDHGVIADIHTCGWTNDI